VFCTKDFDKCERGKINRKDRDNQSAVVEAVESISAEKRRISDDSIERKRQKQFNITSNKDQMIYDIEIDLARYVNDLLL
jgi:Na+/phosphate symporter